MLNAVKQSVHRMTSQLQLISSYLEMMDYAKALGRTKETIKEMHGAGGEPNGAGKPGDDRAGEWGRSGSAWLHSGEPRRCECGCRQ